MALLLVFASGLARSSACEPSASFPELDIDLSPVSRYYVDVECPPVGCPDFLTVWVYEETNGLDGLQRADELVDNTCGGLISGDTYMLPV